MVDYVMYCDDCNFLENSDDLATARDSVEEHMYVSRRHEAHVRYATIMNMKDVEECDRE